MTLPLAAISGEKIRYGDITGRHDFTRAPGDLLNPKRMTQADLVKLKAQWSDAAFAAQFQQHPVGVGGNLIKREWLTYIDAPLRSGVVVQSWDTATATSEAASFSACLTWRVQKDRFELIDVFRDRVTPERIGELAIALAKRHRARKVLVEKANAGFIVGTALKKLGGVSVEMCVPMGSKEQRLDECLGAFQQLMVLLPSDAPWLSVYESELLSFPNARHDDQVDATTQFLKWALPIALGDAKDPVFRQHAPVVAGTSAGGGPKVMQIGGRFVRPGQKPSLRPRGRF